MTTRIDGTNTNTDTDYGKVVHCSTKQEYYDAIDSAGSRLVVVDCFAERCPPCQQIAPLFEALARDDSNSDIVFVKVDIGKVPSIQFILGVWAVPSFYFLKEGSKVGSFTGANEALLKTGIANDGKVGGICSSCSVQ